MPLMQCQKDGQAGWKWGETGFCYTGPQAKEKAAQQGQAIEASKSKQDAKTIKCGDGHITAGVYFKG